MLVRLLNLESTRAACVAARDTQAQVDAQSAQDVAALQAEAEKDAALSKQWQSRKLRERRAEVVVEADGVGGGGDDGSGLHGDGGGGASGYGDAGGWGAVGVVSYSADVVCKSYSVLQTWAGNHSALYIRYILCRMIACPSKIEIWKVLECFFWSMPSVGSAGGRKSRYMVK